MPAMTGRYRAMLLYVGYGLLAALLAAGLLLVVARRPAGLPVQLQDPPSPLPLRVHVTGAVAAPGVYSLPPGSIVQDALAAAGGATARADLGLLNLAHRLQDGEQVLVPELSPTRAAVATGGAVPANSTSSVTPSSNNQININTATVAELVALPRVGPALAQRIVDYRATHGPFRAVEDIMQVKGIGPATFAQIKDLISVN
jgi:competence protein ComEA